MLSDPPETRWQYTGLTDGELRQVSSSDVISREDFGVNPKKVFGHLPEQIQLYKMVNSLYSTFHIYAP